MVKIIFWHAVGVTAATLTMFSFIPQIIKVIKNKSAHDVSLFTLVQLSAGVFLWVIYGIYKRDVIIITANCITLTTLVILLFLYSFFNRRRAL